MAISDHGNNINNMCALDIHACTVLLEVHIHTYVIICCITRQTYIHMTDP